MPRERQVYLLDPRQLGPETIAVTFAKTSRSPQSFREIASELTDEKSAQFNERWVVGYGHSSVAEHAVLHLAVENISRLAVECLQSNRLASFTEKSTRYQQWNNTDFYLPKEFAGTKSEKVFEEIIHYLFDTYQKSTLTLCELIKEKYLQLVGVKEKVYETQIRSMPVDASRFLLPAASLANVGITINARELEHAICKMLSHNLSEVRQVGEEIRRISQQAVPTLVKYAHQIPSLSDSCQDLPQIRLEKSFMKQGSAGCKLMKYDTQGEDHVLAAILYRYGSMSYEQSLLFLRNSSREDKEKIINRVMGTLGEHDRPIRELEYASFTFDIQLDQGAYYELKRHRMMTQTPQQLSTRMGYAVPKAFADAGLEVIYRKAMDNASKVFEDLVEIHPYAAAYIVPNGFYRQVLIELNLREAFAFLSLRSAPNAHFSLRLLAHQMAEQIRQVCPLFGKYLKINEAESWQQIQKDYFV
jgi:thymidylate synthase ThyX